MEIHQIITVIILYELLPMSIVFFCIWKDMINGSKGLHKYENPRPIPRKRIEFTKTNDLIDRIDELINEDGKAEIKQ